MTKGKVKIPVQGQPQGKLRRSLGLFDSVAILIGITIGSGIFRTPKEIAGYQSSLDTILWLWIIAGLFVFIGGLIYAELGTRLPKTGGEYVYIHHCFGPQAGFMFGWAQLFIIRTSSAAGLAIVAADYIGFFISFSVFERNVVALMVLAVFGTLNYLGIKRASFYTNFSVIVKVGGLLALVVIGLVLTHGKEGLLWSTAPATGSLGVTGNTVAAVMLIVFSYIGWDRVGYVAEEMKDPKRAVPLTMIFGIALIIFIYVSATMIYHHVLGIEGVRNSSIVASDMATLLLGPVGAIIIALLVIVAVTGSINGTMMTATRCYYAMAKDGLFFKWLDYVHPKYNTPSRAVIVHCLWASVILLLRGTFETIVSGMVFAVLIFYALTTVALFKLRREGSNEEGVFKMPFYPVLPILYLAGIIILLSMRAWYEWQTTLIDLMFIVSGVPFAWYFSRRKRGR